LDKRRSAVVDLARWTVRRRGLVLGLTLGVVLLAGLFGGSVAKHLSSGGFDSPGSESIRVRNFLDAHFPIAANPNVALLVTAASGSVDTPGAAADGVVLTDELAAWPHMSKVVSYWSLGRPGPLRSDDRRDALVVGLLRGTDDQVHDRIPALEQRFTSSSGPIHVRVGATAALYRQVSNTIQSDLARAESIALPVTLVLLVVVFGSAVSGAIPVGIGILAILGTFLVLRLVSLFTPVSIFSLNLATAMGLGLAIDYSLFIVSRYREELASGQGTKDAIVMAEATAGRTVVFSAATVAASLAALLVFPIYFLRSFAYAGIGVVVIAAAGAIFTLPALLAALGPRIDRWAVGRRYRGQHVSPESGFWHRLASTVMRRPVATGLPVLLLLLVLGVPFLHVAFGLPDQRVLPAGNPTRQVQDQIDRDFPHTSTSPVIVLAPSLGAPRAHLLAIDAYARTLSRLPTVTQVDALTGSYNGGRQVVGPAKPNAQYAAARSTWWSVVTSAPAISPRAESLVASIRSLPAPVPVLVGGPSAQLTDEKSALASRLPLAAALIVLVTLVVLFLFTGSVVVPVKAVIMNLLSLTATFGAMVWIFQEGHGAGVLGFTPTGTIDTTSPIIMFCIAFGLSMDYEVFLLSRIKEEYDLSGDNERSVALGLERTGRIITAAAVLVAVVFLAFATSRITFIKLFGVGLAVAVLMDATLVRGVLVPSFMRLMGDLNWWAPAPLRRFYQRWGQREDSGRERSTLTTAPTVDP
jgi:putative drug exporter of the RND superfamily